MSRSRWLMPLLATLLFSAALVAAPAVQPGIRTGRVATNIASYVAAGQVRLSVIGAENRPPTPAELERMTKLVAGAMEDGAFGLVTSLEAIAGYASTDEIAELAKVAGQYGGIYATHLRGESDELVEALNEAIESQVMGVLFLMSEDDVKTAMRAASGRRQVPLKSSTHD